MSLSLQHKRDNDYNGRCDIDIVFIYLFIKHLGHVWVMKGQPEMTQFANR